MPSPSSLTVRVCLWLSWGQERPECENSSHFRAPPRRPGVCVLAGALSDAPSLASIVLPSPCPRIVQDKWVNQGDALLPNCLSPLLFFRPFLALLFFLRGIRSQKTSGQRSTNQVGHKSVRLAAPDEREKERERAPWRSTGNSSFQSNRALQLLHWPTP